MTSSHHNWGLLHYKMGPFGRFFNLLGYTTLFDNPDSWEGWMWAPFIPGVFTGALDTMSPSDSWKTR